MLVKTNENNIFHQPNNYYPDNVIALLLEESDIKRKNDLLGESFNEEVYYGDIGRFLYALLTWKSSTKV